MDWVIDCDAHISEPGDLWTSRLPARMQDGAPRIVRNPDTGWEVWQLGDSTAMVPVGHTAVAGWKDPFPAAPSSMDEIPKAAWDPTARRSEHPVHCRPAARLGTSEGSAL